MIRSLPVMLYLFTVFGMDWAELFCQTCYSFLEAAAHPEELVTRASGLGYRALAITDECSVAGVVKAHAACRAESEAGGSPPRLIVGSYVCLSEGDRLVLLAANADGYAALCRLITRARGRARKGDYRLERADLVGLDPGLLAIWLVDEPVAGEPAMIAACFPGRFWLGCPAWQDGLDARRQARAAALAQSGRWPVTAVGGVRMHEPGRKPLLDVMTAIRHRTTVQEAGAWLMPNARRHLRPIADLAALFPEAWMQQTLEIAGRCGFSLDEVKYQYPQDDIPPGKCGDEHLRALTEQGMAERWPQGVPEQVRVQVAHELAVIAELGYAAYFLTVHDLVRFARARGILCQGRGSAANSAVCYALGITAVNPAESSMLFERFISKERGEPPDIDVDFEHERREEVIQYLFERYGRDRAALTASVITYRRRSALRDVGRALGIDATAIDRLADNLSWWEREVPAERLEQIGLAAQGRQVRLWLELARTLCGFPRHLSQHVGGFVIARDRLVDLVPVEPASMAGRSVIQWDKDDLAAMGLMKVDVLALGMLTALRRALALIGQHRGESMALWQIPREDPATWAMIQRADTVGVFQIESRAQMSMLPRLRPRCFHDLVIEIALVRPGPIQGQMVHPYLRRRDGLEPVEYPSPEVARVLKRTLGVPIFQEQVIELAMVAGGFTAGEADQLRRALGAWKRKGQLEPFRQRLFRGMVARGYAPDYAERIFQQILGFGEYGFPESHSASFALLAYASAWIKCHEPAAFYCALLNSQPMGFYGPAQLVQDARRHGVEVRPVCVNHSAVGATLEPGQRAGTLALRLGLGAVRGLGRHAAEQLVSCRIRGKPFDSVPDVARRCGLDQARMAALARAGAFASLAQHRRRALWEAQGAVSLPGLLCGAEATENPPELAPPAEIDDLHADYEGLGLTLGRHPLALLRHRLAGERVHTAATLARTRDGAHVTYAGLVTTRQRPGSAKGTVFLTLEDETGSVNVIVWPTRVARFRRPVSNGRLLQVRGQWQVASGVANLVAGHVKDISELIDKLHFDSRDFR
ncbi:MAG: error-prone DNA polymerase [Halothiobacillaceae bacterium]